MPVSPDAITQQVVDLLPADGTPVLNRVMRAMVSRRLGRLVTPDQYFAARDELFKAGRIGRERGQGGKLFLLQEEPASKPPSAAPDILTEVKLMPHVARFLNTVFIRDMDLPANGLALVQDISRVGPLQGQWARPDFMLVSAMRFQFLPGLQVTVHSFEVKTESGGSVLAVHEALAQTRFTHFGHLVWHLPETSKARARLDDVEGQCETHGIGLILILDPSDADAGFEVRLDPRHRQTEPKEVDGFLESRLTPENKQALQGALGRGGQE